MDISRSEILGGWKWARREGVGKGYLFSLPPFGEKKDPLPPFFKHPFPHTFFG